MGNISTITLANRMIGNYNWTAFARSNEFVHACVKENHPCEIR